MFKKIYIVEGFTWEHRCSYPLDRRRMVFRKYSKARKEIDIIIKEVTATAKEIEWNLNIEWKEDFQTLEVQYPDGTIDNYCILEKKIF